ncbi:MAG: hypothetical protein STSR0008_17670 [Ignavibacterium sp.]
MNHLSEEIILDFIDENISEEIKKDVLTHLSECDICRNKLIEFQKVDELFYQINQLNAPDEINEKVMKKISRQLKSEKQQKNFFVFSIIFISSILITTIALIFSSVDKVKIGNISEIEIMSNKFIVGLNKILSLFLDKIYQNNLTVTFITILILIVSILFLIDELKNQKIKPNLFPKGWISKTN